MASRWSNNDGDSGRGPLPRDAASELAAEALLEAARAADADYQRALRLAASCAAAGWEVTPVTWVNHAERSSFVTDYRGGTFRVARVTERDGRGRVAAAGTVAVLVVDGECSVTRAGWRSDAARDAALARDVQSLAVQP